ncbi:HAMP domain-containing histidine kinase [Reichenbachiella agarivorans]|uniref:histidine kinase n=1 Tax=Reichenbachiella agarivorans TaxID=2979464 RepID=A0ABY6CQ93_9BACT|nr:HAMP domain-containing sensor histidine kinase [Reichenbachiella agarivorans]UXP32200.1 HAMP domain-containing histidine kinase [Reichenbachiella agarivorans]
MKIENKIILVLLAVFVSYSLLFSGFIYYSIFDYAFMDFYKRLEIRAITAAKIYVEHETEVMVIRELRQEYLEKLPDENIELFELTELYHSPHKHDLSAYKKEFINEILDNGSANYNDQRIFYYGMIYESAINEKYVVLASAENYFITHHVSYFRNILVGSFMIAFFIILLVSYLFSQKITQPINDIIKKVKEISSGNLHMRLEVNSGKEDTIGDLTRTFNDMLNRLEASFESQKNFISNASHELNTPLTTIIGEADVALSKMRTSDYYIESLMTILEEAEKLNKKTHALLRLAQTGFDGKKQEFSRFRIDQLILDVKETVMKISPNSQVNIDFNLLPENHNLLKIEGSETLLHLALSNLILNGCKYSGNQPVRVALGVSPEQIIILIKDTGIGIPEEELQFIYDPYFRATNTRNHEGYGIGLPLARNIIQMHDGKLQINSEMNKGTVVRVLLKPAKIESPV